MIQKLAVLVVEKADGTTIATPGEKGDITTKAKALIREINDSEAHDIYRVTALGTMGVLKEKRWKANTPTASAPVQAPSDEQDEAEEIDSPSDVQALREALKAKGVKVPPRISVDNLLALAVEHGVEG